MKQAREAAGYKRVPLARLIGVPDRTIERLERSIGVMPSTASADLLIATVTIASTEAKDLLRARKRRK